MKTSNINDGGSGDPGEDSGIPKTTSQLANNQNKGLLII